MFLENLLSASSWQQANITNVEFNMFFGSSSFLLIHVNCTLHAQELITSYFAICSKGNLIIVLFMFLLTFKGKAYSYVYMDTFLGCSVSPNQCHYEHKAILDGKDFPCQCAHNIADEVPSPCLNQCSFHILVSLHRWGTKMIEDAFLPVPPAIVTILNGNRKARSVQELLCGRTWFGC